jgi:hypothetical protein
VAVADRRATRRLVWASSRSGSCTPVIPLELHAIPHRPMAVSNRANPSAGGPLASGLAIALLLCVAPILARQAPRTTPIC